MWCDTQRWVILRPQARHHPPASFVPPLSSVAQPRYRPASLLPFQNFHFCLQRTWTPQLFFPPAVSPSSLPLGPSLAPGRPVYVPLRRLLITTWIQAGKGLRRLGRQQKATDLQSSHSLYTVTGPATTMIEDRKRDRCAFTRSCQACAHSCVHACVSVCVNGLVIKRKDEFSDCCIRWGKKDYTEVLISIHTKYNSSR